MITILSFFVNVPDTAASLITFGFCTTGSFLMTGELLLLLYDDLPLYHQLVFPPCCGLPLYCPCQKLTFVFVQALGALLGAVPPVRVVGSELRMTTAFFFAI